MKFVTYEMEQEEINQPPIENEDNNCKGTVRRLHQNVLKLIVRESS